MLIVMAVMFAFLRMNLMADEIEELLNLIAMTYPRERKP